MTCLPKWFLVRHQHNPIVTNTAHRSFVDRTPSSAEAAEGGGNVRGLVTFYSVNVSLENGVRWVVDRRFSDFFQLFYAAKKVGSLNNKRGEALVPPKKEWGVSKWVAGSTVLKESRRVQFEMLLSLLRDQLDPATTEVLGTFLEMEEHEQQAKASKSRRSRAGGKSTSKAEKILGVTLGEEDGKDSKDGSTVTFKRNHKLREHKNKRKSMQDVTDKYSSPVSPLPKIMTIATILMIVVAVYVSGRMGKATNVKEAREVVEELLGEAIELMGGGEKLGEQAEGADVIGMDAVER